MANPNERHSMQEQGSQKSGQKSGGMVQDPARDASKQHQQQIDQSKQHSDQRDRAKPQQGSDADRNRQQR